MHLQRVYPSFQVFQELISMLHAVEFSLHVSCWSSSSLLLAPGISTASSVAVALVKASAAEE